MIDVLHRDFKMGLVKDIVKKYTATHEKRLHHHVNVDPIQLQDTTDLNLVKIFKRTEPFELL